MYASQVCLYCACHPPGLLEYRPRRPLPGLPQCRPGRPLPGLPVWTQMSAARPATVRTQASPARPATVPAQRVTYLPVWLRQVTQSPLWYLRHLSQFLLSSPKLLKWASTACAEQLIHLSPAQNTVSWNQMYLSPVTLSPLEWDSNVTGDLYVDWIYTFQADFFLLNSSPHFLIWKTNRIKLFQT